MAVSAPVRSTVRLTATCNNRCVFCAQEGLRDESPAPLEERLRALRAQGACELTFTGGEPMLAEGLLHAVGAAREAGFTGVGLQTNGRLLAAQVRALKGAGLTDVHVSLHGASAPVHDYHTGVAGSFAALGEGIVAARADGLSVAVVTVVTRSNFRVVSQLPRALHALGVNAWLLELPVYAGRAASNFDPVIPRLGLAVPFALHALDAALKLGIPSFIRGAPLCALGPFAAHALVEPGRAFASRCEGCAARPGCAGVEAVYLARFGDGELNARAPVADAAAHPLARLFVGPGPLHVVQPARVEPSPAAAREALPNLGKVRPAAQEVAPGTAKKSGDALKEILPKLFERS
jgi:hypothetical protein